MKKQTFHQIENHADDWWLQTKAKIISLMVEKNFHDKNITILDAASGTGFIAQKLSQDGYTNITVSDRSQTAIRILRKKFDNVIPINLPQKISIRNKFDCILALDVLEHIEDDLASLEQLRKLLKINGVLIITVPAFNFLWSKKDDILEHKRRYTKATLINVIKKNNLSINYISYFNFFLFIPALVYSFANKNKEIITRYNSIQNALFSRIFSFELPLLNHSISFPFGVSILAIVKNEN